MDHRDALKGFRPGATIKSVFPRMSPVDAFGKIHERRSWLNAEQDTSVVTEPQENTLSSRQASNMDIEHIIPVVALIIRQGALQTTSDQLPKNV